MPNLNDILVGGFPVAAIVVALVALAKRVGLPAEYAPYLNGVLSAGLWLLATVVIPGMPETTLVTTVVATIVIFLQASGIYQFGKTSK